MPSTPNTLTSLAPTLYEALDVVSRELVGLVPAVTLDSQAARAAVGQTVMSHVAPASSASDIAPDVNAPDNGNQTIGNVTLTISKARAVPVRWNGEEQRAMNSGPGYRNILRDQFAQAYRTLSNEIESDLAGLYVNASRQYGAGGSVPFGTANDYTDASYARKILVDNGAPISDMHLVLNTGAGANLRGKQAAVNTAGSDSILRQGVLLDIHGFAIRESAQIKSHTIGTTTTAVTNATGYAVGATSITLKAAGTGTIVDGDTITFAGDPNKYVVKTGVGAVSGGVIVLQAPGLMKALPAAETNITVEAAGPRNMAFARSAIVLATRAPQRPEEGDAADDVMLVTDPRSGLTFEVALYKQYRQIRYEISAAWGVKCVKPEHLALLAG
jgi:hypothetical protein